MWRTLSRKFDSLAARLIAVAADCHAFAARQPVGFDDERPADGANVGEGGVRVVEGLPVGRGNPGGHHHLLGEDLAGLNPGGGARRPDNGQAGRLEVVDDARSQGRLGTHNREVGANGLRGFYERGAVRGVER